MSRSIAIGIAVLAIVAAVGGYIYSQRAQIALQRATIAAQGERIGGLQTANAAQAATISAMEASKKENAALILGTAEKVEALAASFRVFDRKAMEALKHADLTLDSVLPADAVTAFCLQYLAAGGKLPADYQGAAAAGAHAGAADPSPAGGGGYAVDCSGFGKITVRDAVSWNALLLRHAGEEREDKAALRQWAAAKGAE